MPPPSKKSKLKSDDNANEEGTETLELPVAPPSADKPDSADDDTAARRTLFVRSLDYTTTTENLTTHFSYAGPIKHATVVVDPATKASRGFGFVTFVDPADAQTAIKEFNGKLLGGRHIKVEVAQARHRDAANGSAEKVTGAGTAQGKDAKRRAPRLIIRNLPWSIKKPEQLEVHFRMYGKIKSVIIPRKGGGKTGPMSGFAIVTMRNTKNAEKAMAGVNGKVIDNRTVAVDWAVEKDEWVKSGHDQDEDESMVDADGGGEQEADAAEDSSSSAESEGDDDSEGVSDGDTEGEDEDDDEELADGDDGDDKESKTADNNYNESTVFIRNLAFTTEEDGLYEHFSSTFGPVRYARVVMDHATERPRGTAFVCFYKTSDCDECLKQAPQSTVQKVDTGGKHGNKQSILQSDDLDPTGKYTLDGRVLSLTRAVSRDEAEKLTVANSNSRDRAQRDRRHLYLLSEGSIPTNSPLYAMLSKKDIALREASLKQRKTFVEKNPSLHLSLTRLSVRNIPRNVTEKQLKYLARKAIVEFASDVKRGTRNPLSKEELARGGPELKEEEKRRKAQGKGIVKQVKIVREDKGAGRSKGYGFIEYVGHRCALMGLRWLNAREVANVSDPDDNAAAKNQKQQDFQTKGKHKKHSNGKEANNKTDGSSGGPESFPEDRKRRLIVEFALENVQVVTRRREKENKARERAKASSSSTLNEAGGGDENREIKDAGKKQKHKQTKAHHGKAMEKDKPSRQLTYGTGSSMAAKKRKRDPNDSGDASSHTGNSAGLLADTDGISVDDKKSKAAKASRVIARKRQERKFRRKGSAKS